VSAEKRYAVVDLDALEDTVSLLQRLTAPLPYPDRLLADAVEVERAWPEASRMWAEVER
jgi:hypothetical protein